MHIKDHSAAMKFFRTYDNVASKGKWKEFVDEMEFDSMLQEPRTMAQEPRNMVQEPRMGFADEGLVSGYTKKARTANQIKYEKVLKEMLDEIDVIKEKGYGNISNIVEKYSDQLGLAKEKVKKYYDADGIFKKHAWNVEQSKIRGAVIDAAKQADITDLPDNMIKAVEDYKKFKGKITNLTPLIIGCTIKLL